MSSYHNHVTVRSQICRLRLFSSGAVLNIHHLILDATLTLSFILSRCILPCLLLYRSLKTLFLKYSFIIFSNIELQLDFSSLFFEFHICSNYISILATATRVQWIYTVLTAFLKSTPALDTLVHHLWSRGRTISPPTLTVVDTIILLDPKTVMRTSKSVLASSHDDRMKATYGGAMPCLC